MRHSRLRSVGISPHMQLSEVHAGKAVQFTLKASNFQFWTNQCSVTKNNQVNSMSYLNDLLHCQDVLPPAGGDWASVCRFPRQQEEAAKHADAAEGNKFLHSPSDLVYLPLKRHGAAFRASHKQDLRLDLSFGELHTAAEWNAKKTKWTHWNVWMLGC